MFKRLIISLIVILSLSTNVHAEVHKNIEIFNINQGKVERIIQSNSKIQETVVSYLQGIDGLYSKFNPIPDRGYAVRIPLSPSTKIEGRWLNAIVDEVIIMFPENEQSFLMVFEDGGRLLCFEFKGNRNILLKELAL